MNHIVDANKKVRRCSGCGKAGHYRPKCPEAVIPYDPAISREANRQRRNHALGLCAKCGGPKRNRTALVCRICADRYNQKYRERFTPTVDQRCSICGVSGHNRLGCPKVSIRP